jgi:heterotetrameric sarcosine oxidase gamma subunit
MAEVAALEFSAADCQLVQIEAWDGRIEQFKSDLSRTFGIALPATVGETIRQPSLRAIKVAPRRFWLLYDTPGEPPIEVDPDLGSVTDLGEGRIRVRLCGDRLPRVLAGCIAVDWHSPAVAPSKAIQTSFHGVPVLFVRTGEAECELVVPRSFARSILDWLEDGARGVALEGSDNSGMHQKF